MKKIALFGRNGKGKYALVDDEDYEVASGFRWYLEPNRVRANRPHGTDFPTVSISLHRLIMGFPNVQVDHRDGNRLNNQRSNLRLATSAQNSQNRGTRSDNSTGYKGVHYRGEERYPSGRLWRARITCNGQRISLGSFKSAKEAAIAYNEAALKYHGAYARLNTIV